MPQLNLYVDTTANLLVAGLNSSTPVDPASLPFYFGDTLSLNIYLLNRTTSPNQQGTQYQVLNNAGLQLFLYLDDGTVAGTVYANQIVWVADANNQYLSAQLALNTLALQTL